MGTCSITHSQVLLLDDEVDHPPKPRVRALKELRDVEEKGRELARCEPLLVLQWAPELGNKLSISFIDKLD